MCFLAHGVFKLVLLRREAFVLGLPGLILLFDILDIGQRLSLLQLKIYGICILLLACLKSNHDMTHLAIFSLAMHFALGV